MYIAPLNRLFYCSICAPNYPRPFQIIKSLPLLVLNFTNLNTRLHSSRDFISQTFWSLVNYISSLLCVLIFNTTTPTSKHEMTEKMKLKKSVANFEKYLGAKFEVCLTKKKWQILFLLSGGAIKHAEFRAGANPNTQIMGSNCRGSDRPKLLSRFRSVCGRVRRQVL